jgi:flavodoxin
MNILIVYYSRTGITRKVADELAEALSADIEEIVDVKGRGGPLGFVVACKDSVRQKSARIELSKRDPADYDVVVVGTPVWANTMACAVRTWLNQAAGKIKRLACFCTLMRTNWGATFDDMGDAAGLEPSVGAAFRQKDVKADSHRKALEDFAAAIRALEAPDQPSEHDGPDEIDAN